MRHYKITILGCSVAIRVRPPQKYPENKNYGQFLLSDLSDKYNDVCFTVNNKAFTRATLKDIMPKIDYLISDYPDLFILNIGIPDVSTREIPRCLSNLISYKSELFISKLFLIIHNLIIKPRIRFFVKLRGKRPWVSKKEFEKLYDKLIQYILKETNSQIIIIPINPPSKRIEDKLPGTIKNVEEYNKIIYNLASKYNIKTVNINDLNREIDFPDGIHYSVSGHKKMSRKIQEYINI